MPLTLWNTRTHSLEPFAPLHPPHVGLYTCGPTVYGPPHIGNLRSYLFADTLRRVLTTNGFQVTQVMNITDVGHLTGDSDAGEEKMDRAQKEMLFFKCRDCGKTVPSFISASPKIWKETGFINNTIRCLHCGYTNAGLNHDDLFHITKDYISPKERILQIAQNYTSLFKEDLAALNIAEPDVWAPATEHIPEQVALVERLIARGHAYETEQAVYFDVSTFPTYGALTGQKLDDKLVAAREGVQTDAGKRHPADFALWFKRTGRFANHILSWPSPWGDGFPGWHLECSAMSMKYLGEQFDIHTGGVDHIMPHHSNEIAQSEAATGKAPFVNVWMHGEHLVTGGKRMGKSEGNLMTLDELEARGVAPLAYRFYVLQTHYRKRLSFSHEALKAAAEGYANLVEHVRALGTATGPGCAGFEQRFRDAVNDDLNTPQALAVLSDLLKADCPDGAKRQSINVFDQVLGLGLAALEAEAVDVPASVQELAASREEARRAKDFARADELRQAIEAAGFTVEDAPAGPRLRRR